MKNTQKMVTIKTLQMVTMARQAKKTIGNNYQIRDNASDLEKLINIAYSVVISGTRYMYDKAKQANKSLEFVKDLQLLTSYQRLQYVQRINAGWTIERAYNTDNDHVQTAFAILYQYHKEGISPFDKALEPLKKSAKGLQSPFYRASNRVQYDILKRYKQDCNADSIEDKQAKGQQLTDKAAKIALPDYDIIVAWLDNSHIYKKMPANKQKTLKSAMVLLAKGHDIKSICKALNVPKTTLYRDLQKIKADIISTI